MSTFISKIDVPEKLERSTSLDLTVLSLTYRMIIFYEIHERWESCRSICHHSLYMLLFRSQVSSVHTTCINRKLHTGKKGGQGRRSIEGCVIDSNKTVQRKHVIARFH